MCLLHYIHRKKLILFIILGFVVTIILVYKANYVTAHNKLVITPRKSQDDLYHKLFNKYIFLLIGKSKFNYHKNYRKNLNKDKYHKAKFKNLQKKYNTIYKKYVKCGGSISYTIDKTMNVYDKNQQLELDNLLLKLINLKNQIEKFIITYLGKLNRNSLKYLLEIKPLHSTHLTLGKKNIKQYYVYKTKSMLFLLKYLVRHRINNHLNKNNQNKRLNNRLHNTVHINDDPLTMINSNTITSEINKQLSCKLQLSKENTIKQNEDREILPNILIQIQDMVVDHYNTITNLYQELLKSLIPLSSDQTNKEIEKHNLLSVMLSSKTIVIKVFKDTWLVHLLGLDMGKEEWFKKILFDHHRSYLTSKPVIFSDIQDKEPLVIAYQIKVRKIRDNFKLAMKNMGVKYIDLHNDLLNRFQDLCQVYLYISAVFTQYSNITKDIPMFEETRINFKKNIFNYVGSKHIKINNIVREDVLNMYKKSISKEWNNLLLLIVKHQAKQLT